jgi:hypothetical protein
MLQSEVQLFFADFQDTYKSWANFYQYRSINMASTLNDSLLKNTL